MQARGYQLRAEKEAVTALRGGGGFLLTLEQRTGKTLVAVNVYRHYRSGLPLLVVCPKVAIPVWKKALKEFPEAIIVTYDNISDNSNRWYRWADKHYGFFMIVDEAHLIKHRGAARSRVVRTVAKRSQYRLALTGTPISQGLQDAWALFDYLGHIFGPWDDTWEGGLDGRLIPGFESRYLLYGGFKAKQIVGYQNEDDFYEIYDKYSFRITLREAKREGKKSGMVLRFQKKFFDLNPEARDVYDELQETLEAVVNESKVRVPNVLACVSKLQQIAGGFFIEKIPTGQVTPQGKPVYRKDVHKLPGRSKLDFLVREILPTLRGRFIVICRFIHELEAVQKAIRKAGSTCAMVRGGIPYDGEFRTKAICMQIQSGMAVDMSKADTIVFYSTDYSYVNFEQSRFRILNYDKSFGKYIFLLARDTVDEVIYAAIKSKKRVAELVVDKFRRKRNRNGRKLAETNRKPEGKTKGQTWGKYRKLRIRLPA